MVSWETRLARGVAGDGDAALKRQQRGGKNDFRVRGRAWVSQFAGETNWAERFTSMTLSHLRQKCWAAGARRIVPAC